MDKPERASDEPIAVELIKDGIYSWCSCGLSINQPYCDGKHTRTTDIKPIVFKAEKTGTHYLCMCKETKTKPYCDGTHKF